MSSNDSQLEREKTEFFFGRAPVTVADVYDYLPFVHLIPDPNGGILVLAHGFPIGVTNDSSLKFAIEYLAMLQRREKEKRS